MNLNLNLNFISKINTSNNVIKIQDSRLKKTLLLQRRIHVGCKYTQKDNEGTIK